jgi:GWxTD domain-containing protein
MLITVWMLAGFFVLSVQDVAAKKNTAGKLPEFYRKWLEEEVVYIISSIERQVFLKLGNDRERNVFIEAFWKHRDPTPATEENEYKKEHYKRFAHVNHKFGRTSPLPGWKSDRGRIYIILGPPISVLNYESKQGIYPCELWFYQDLTRLGLPAGLHLLFYQEGGLGDFKLYIPSRDGPQALLMGYFGNPYNFEVAYEKVRDIDATLGDATMSIIPGDSGRGLPRPSMASEVILKKVEALHWSKLEDKYARKFLEYKDSVEIEYTANYIDNHNLVKIFRHPAGVNLVNYMIELKTLSVDTYDLKYYTALKLIGNVSTMTGDPVYQFNKSITINLTAQQLQEVSRHPFAIQDSFPLISGRFRLVILLKNEVSKQFTSLEKTIIIPRETGKVELTTPLLGYRTRSIDNNPNALRPFQLGNRKIYCQPESIFSRNDTLTAAFQVWGLEVDKMEHCFLRFTISNNNDIMVEKVHPVSQYKSWPNVIESFPMGALPPAYYRIDVALQRGSDTLATAGQDFSLSPRSDLNRPWIYAKLLPAVTDPACMQIIGKQLFQTGEIAGAEKTLAKAFQRLPDSFSLATDLAIAYQAQGKAELVLSLLQPFLKQNKADNADGYLLVGHAQQRLRQWEAALKTFADAAAHFGISTLLLNEMGSCYLNLQRQKEALAAWKKSLELNPDQPEIQKFVDALRKKK